MFAWGGGKEKTSVKSDVGRPKMGGSGLETGLKAGKWLNLKPFIFSGMEIASKSIVASYSYVIEFMGLVSKHTLLLSDVEGGERVSFLGVLVPLGGPRGGVASRLRPRGKQGCCGWESGTRIASADLQTGVIR